MQEANMTVGRYRQDFARGWHDSYADGADVISQLTKAPVIDDVNPDEAVAEGASIQAILSLLEEEISFRRTSVTDRYARTIFVARRRSDSGYQHHLPHPRCCVLGRGAPGGIRFSNDPQMTAIPARARRIHLVPPWPTCSAPLSGWWKARARCRANARPLEFVTWSFQRFCRKVRRRTDLRI